MRRNKLQILASIFKNQTKEAGELKYPIYLYNEIFKWVLSIVIAKVYKIADQKQKRIRRDNPRARLKFFNLQLIKNDCLKYTDKNTINLIGDYSLIEDYFSYKWEELPYFNNHPNFRKMIKKKKLKEWTRVSVGIHFDQKGTWGEEQGWPEHTSALWSSYSNYIGIGAFDLINIDYPDRILEVIKSLKDRIRHELQHMVQTRARDLFAVLENSKFWILDNEVIQDAPLIGFPNENVGGNFTENQHSLIDNQVSHDLLSVEYHTVLSDSIAELKRKLLKVPEKLRPYVIKYWVGEQPYIEYDIYNDLKLNELKFSVSPFFKELRNNNPPLYNKAVKELYKAVDI